VLQIYLFSALLLMTCSSTALAGNINAPLLITAETVPHELHAKAYETDAENAEDNQRHYRHRLFPTAAGDAKSYEIRIQLTQGLPSHISLQGKHAHYWQYTIDEQSMLIIRANSEADPLFNPANSLLNVAVHY